tara:strand:- start:819 stop:1118 length:300 start_codon:yes stop_codon:yes gene_type:complete
MNWEDIIKRKKEYLVSFSYKEGKEPRYLSAPPHQYVKWALYKKEDGKWVRSYEPKHFTGERGNSLYGVFGWHSTLGHKIKFYNVDENKYVEPLELGLRL